MHARLYPVIAHLQTIKGLTLTRPIIIKTTYTEIHHTAVIKSVHVGWDITNGITHCHSHITIAAEVTCIQYILVGVLLAG